MPRPWPAFACLPAELAALRDVTTEHDRTEGEQDRGVVSPEEYSGCLKSDDRSSRLAFSGAVGLGRDLASRLAFSGPSVPGLSLPYRPKVFAK